MTAAQRPDRGALNDFLPELDVRREPDILDPREIQLDAVGFPPEPADPRRPPIVEGAGVQLWPMLAAALVGIGVAILGFVVFNSFVQ
jgi:hypothetical protein